MVLLAEKCGQALAQDASLLLVPPTGPKQKPGLNLANTSFMYRQLPPEAEQRELQLNDIITVLVDYKSALQSDGDALYYATEAHLGVVNVSRLP